MTETRAEEAQRLVDEGGVHLVYEGPTYIQASVHSKHARYTTVVYENGTFWCTCQHGLYHAHTTDLCVHALALRLLIEKEVGDAKT